MKCHMGFNRGDIVWFGAGRHWGVYVEPIIKNQLDRVDIYMGDGYWIDKARCVSHGLVLAESEPPEDIWPQVTIRRLEK